MHLSVSWFECHQLYIQFLNKPSECFLCIMFVEALLKSKLTVYKQNVKLEI